MPVLNEPLHILGASLCSVMGNIHPESGDELIVIRDKLEVSPQRLQLINRWATRSFRCSKKGKREAIALGLRLAKNEVVIIQDSDTVFTPDSLRELVQPFSDPKVGGSTSNQRIADPFRNIWRTIAQWIEVVRFEVGHVSSQAYFKQVGCLPGRAIAVRKSIVMPYLKEYCNEMFLGKHVVTGDDRVMTQYILQSGYQTVFCPKSLVTTDTPNTFKGLVGQQLRWARSGDRETFKAWNWLYKFPYIAFSSITNIITPFAFVFVIAASIISYADAGSLRFSLSLLGSLFLGLAGMNIVTGAKQHPFLNWHTLKYLPIYALFLMCVLTPIQIYALFTMRNNEWLTRSKAQKG
ncbi:MAG: glycosyltransferase [Candidatus Methanoperedens sp.]